MARTMSEMQPPTPRRCPESMYRTPRGESCQRELAAEGTALHYTGATRMKVAVIGAAGQLGRDLCPRLGGDGELTPLGRDRADLANPDLVRQTLEQLRPDVV